MDLSSKLDFGAGKLTPVTHDGRQWVQFDDLVRFLEGDGPAMLAAVRDSLLASELLERPDGAVLLPWNLIARSMFVCPTDAIGKEHRDGHTAWRRSVLASGGLRASGKQHASGPGAQICVEHGATGNDGGDTRSGEDGVTAMLEARRLTPNQLAVLTRHEAAIVETMKRAPQAGSASANGGVITFRINEDALKSAESVAATERYVRQVADVLKFLMAEELMHKSYSREMVKIPVRGQCVLDLARPDRPPGKRPRLVWARGAQCLGPVAALNRKLKPDVWLDGQPTRAEGNYRAHHHVAVVATGVQNQGVRTWPMTS